MNPVGKALWFIEGQLAEDISLETIAQFAGVSRYQLVRAFGTATGRSVIRYLRGRRLTEAARRLAAGAPDILTVALDAGYGSHEAFTRAFRDQFGQTPEAVREQGHLGNLHLVEIVRMDDSLIVDLEPPRFETGRSLLIAGLGDRFRFESNQGIPALWQRFVPYIGTIPGQIGAATYGICCNADGAGSFDYVAGVEVARFDDVPRELRRVTIPEHRYAVFTHRGHISTLRSTVYTIWNKWLPESGHTLGEAPDFERYDDRFDPGTGTGAVEIWLPIAG
jgi:AraC family transcriptional regulator